MWFKKIRVDFYYWRKRRERKILANRILSFLKLKKDLSDEEQEVFDYLKNNELRVFPYKFIEKYLNQKVTVCWENEYPFIVHNNKKLFFKTSWTEKKASSYYKSLILEQDPNSPHLYCDKSFQIEDDEIVIDIGVAEGSFTFQYINHGLENYIFEKDSEWIKPLKLTFEPYKSRVTIIEKFVGNISDESNVRLDDFKQFYTNKLFIKIDVDGSERKLLDGMKNILIQNQEIKLVICTYHKQNDLEEFVKFFGDLGFNYATSKGYMIFHYDKVQKKPFLRRGVLRVWK